MKYQSQTSTKVNVEASVCHEQLKSFLFSNGFSYERLRLELEWYEQELQALKAYEKATKYCDSLYFLTDQSEVFPLG